MTFGKRKSDHGSRVCVVIIATCLIFFGVSACGGGGGGEPTTPPATTPPTTTPPTTTPPTTPPPGPTSSAGIARSIKMDFATPLLARGEVLQLQPVVRDSAGNVLTAKTLTWTSSDPNIVRVDASAATGNLTAVNTGSAVVTASADGVSATGTATVISIASVSAGYQFSCAITSEGKLYCSGGDYGLNANLVAPALRFTSVSADGVGASSHACGLATDGNAYCWGSNDNGQLGTGDLVYRLNPVRVAGNFRFASVSAGRDYSCGLTTDGDAYCWGNGAFGELGTLTSASVSTPTLVQGGFKFSSIEAGFGTTCALTAAGLAYCWGRNDLGQLGSDEVIGGDLGNQSSVPLAVGGSLANTPLKQIVTRGPKTCGLTKTGQAYCWGNNTVFELGTQTTTRCYGSKPCSLIPLPVKTSALFRTLAASQFATCGITTDGGILCWGLDYQNLFGSTSGLAPGCTGLGYGCTADPVAGPSGFVTLTAGVANHCGMNSDGIAYCWGGNDFGQRSWGGNKPDKGPQPFFIAPDAAR